MELSLDEALYNSTRAVSSKGEFKEKDEGGELGPSLNPVEALSWVFLFILTDSCI